MVELEQAEFRRMVILSVAAHVALLIGTLAFGSTVRSRLFLPVPQAGGPMNVMWATTVLSPPETAPNKLPAPIVQPVIEPPAKAEEPKVVMPEKLKPAPKKPPTKEKKETAEEEARRRAMAEAVAALKPGKETRPTPRPENFPSIPGAPKSPSGLPAGPGGFGGAGPVDPAVAAYQARIQKILRDNLIWVQRGNPQALVTFRVDPDGNILEPELTRGSGNPAFDSAALRAVRKSSPLPPPPPEIAQKIDEVTVHFRLDVR